MCDFCFEGVFKTNSCFEKRLYNPSTNIVYEWKFVSKPFKVSKWRDWTLLAVIIAINMTNFKVKSVNEINLMGDKTDQVGHKMV
jgi:hypothetical protein